MDGRELAQRRHVQCPAALAGVIRPEVARRVREDRVRHVIHKGHRHVILRPDRVQYVPSRETFEAIAIESEVLGDGLPTEFIAVFLSLTIRATATLGVAL